MDTFVRMLADRDSSQIRSNLAFCQILTGDIATGLKNATSAVAGDYEPIFELNKGIAEFLQGDDGAAKASLRNALQQLRLPGGQIYSDAPYVLVLEPEGKQVSSHVDLPVDAAIAVNLWRIGDSTRSEMETALTEHHPKSARAWLARFASP